MSKEIILLEPSLALEFVLYVQSRTLTKGYRVQKHFEYMAEFISWIVNKEADVLTSVLENDTLCYSCLNRIISGEKLMWIRNEGQEFFVHPECYSQIIRGKLHKNFN